MWKRLWLSNLHGPSLTALAVTAPAVCGHRRHCSYHCMGMNYLLYVSSNTWSGGLDLDHAHHHAPLYNCLRIRDQQFGKSFEWMITTAEMGWGDEWTKAFLSGLDDWVDLSLLLLLLLPAEWGQSFAFTSDCCLLLNPEAALLQEPSVSPNLPGFPGAVPGAAAWQVLDTSAMISSF